MTASEVSEIHISPVSQSMGFSCEIASLRQVGADQYDPVRLHYLEVLAQRANAQQEAVKRILDAKLMQGLADFRERFTQAQSDAKNAITQVELQYPQATVDLQKLFNASKFSGVSQYIKALKSSDPRASLGDLIRSIDQHSPGPVEGRLDGNIGTKTELKSVHYFRNTWSKLSADKQVTKALDQAPKNAGPINSHRLVLQSLALMRDISPDYLNRFVSYVDTLLCLDQHNEKKLALAKVAAEAEHGKKMKARRARTR